MTFTPEDGMTPVVHQFMNERQPGQYLLQASWDDAPHLNEATKTQLLAQYPPHERELRSRGIPVFGSGLVFPVAEEKLAIDPIPIPDHWPRVAAIDFGWDHPTAVAWIAHDPESDTIYLYDGYSQNKATPDHHAAAIRARPSFIPIAWPKDGLQTDKGSGISLADQYRKQGINMLPDFFRNPPAPGEKGTVSIEPGIMEMLQRMETDRFKVFNTLTDWFMEFRQYHRKDGKIVPIKDDLMSATRYAVQSLRFAVAGSEGSTGWNMSGSLPIEDTVYF
jgi:hypothetical protein